MSETITESPKTNGVPTLTSVNRVTAIPLVSDSIDQLLAVVTSRPLTDKAYHLAEGVVKSSYNAVSPILGYGRPVIEGADGLANKGLDLAEKNFPYAFQTKTDQIISDARKPADQAFEVVKNVYDNRIGVQAHAVVQKAIDTISNINLQITTTYSSGVQFVHDISGDAQAKVHRLSQILVEQLGQFQKEGNNIPAQARENITKAYRDLSTLLLAKDKPVGKKTKELVSYVQTTLQPVLDKASEVIHATAEEGKEAVDKVQDKAQETDITALGQELGKEIHEGVQENI
ncbi:Perilipin [Phaffia rhodozyma]|uniref:Perilipin n=1 Tax=Phaffia rhodozyma TaxID=264483 RepID=A0A0F7SR49_PHARH|nr:Perilipin [Phaffia rhodozyma]